jgi:glutamate-1-semialdehyde 2,1-aminomutase
MAMLKELSKPGVYDALEEKGRFAANGMAAAAKAAGCAATVNCAGSMFTLFFTDGPVTDWPSAKKSDTGKFAKYFREMLEAGVYLAPSQFEAAFVSLVHRQEDLERLVEAAGKALRNIAR